ncbi:MAG: ATP-binding protein [Bacteroidota bacterium]|nr:ATP-binding protein [Bacteroidota bacterium]
MKELLKSILFDQQKFGWNTRYVRRNCPSSYLSSQEIVVITGIRRCGKSTLLQQIRAEQSEKDYFINFDDERLIQFKVEDFQVLYETFIELFGVQKTFYFDEIQNISGWERFVRRLHDYGNKVFITGSNANMLSRELGTHLTGRYVALELFPFSFSEFLEFSGKTLKQGDIYRTEERSEIKAMFSKFVLFGGFPVFIENQSDNYIKSLYENILYRDVMVRNNLTNEKELLELVYFLASNVSRLSSFNSLAKTIGVKNASTISNYLQFIQNTNLIFQVNKFDFSLKKQIQNPRKTYFIDQALVTRLGFLFSEEKGRLLENIVFIELKRQGNEVFYYSGKNECDFLIRQGIKITNAIQVCYSFDTPETKARELNGLIEAMKAYSLTGGSILTNDTEENIAVEELDIQVVPVWKWILQSIYQDAQRPE